MVIALLAASPETVNWTCGSTSWPPLLYACANGSSSIEVLEVLTKAYPPSKNAIHMRDHKPLHFALGTTCNLERLASPGIVEILSDSGAAMMAVKGGRMPLHYACAYGARQMRKC